MPNTHGRRTETYWLLIKIHSPGRDEVLCVRTRIPGSRMGNQNVDTVYFIWEIRSLHRTFRAALVAYHRRPKWLSHKLTTLPCQVRLRSQVQEGQGEQKCRCTLEITHQWESIAHDNEGIPTLFTDEENHDKDDFVDLLHVDEELQNEMEPL